MNFRWRTSLCALCFIGLSVFGFGAGAQTLEQIDAVKKLKLQADELSKKGDKQEAAERYKDCICLIELQKWDSDKKREFLLRASNEKPEPAVARTWGQNPSKYLFVREILQTIHVKSASDLHSVNELLQTTQFFNGEKDKLVHRLFNEVSAIDASKIEDKHAQLDALQSLFQAMGNQGNYGTPQAKMKSLALDIEPTTDDKHAAQQSRVLWVVLNTFISRSEDPREIGNVRTFRDLILECIALMERYPGKAHVDLSSAIIRAMTVDHPSVLIPILERYIALRKEELKYQPELYQTERCNLGWAYLDAGRLEDAERLFKDISASSRNNRYALSTYEFSELSLGRCYIMQKKFGKAKQCLSSLVALLNGPRFADINHYGAMADGMLGEIAMDERDWRKARFYLERADARMPILTTMPPSFESITFIRSKIPSETSVLRNLVEVYSQLKLKAKVEESSKFLANAESTESLHRLSVSMQEANRQLNMAFYQSSDLLAETLQGYLPKLLKSDVGRQHIFDSLISLIERCQERGANSAGLRCIEEAMKFEEPVMKDRRARLVLLKANFLIAQDQFEPARTELSELTSRTDIPATTKWVASSMIAESLLREGKTNEAENILRMLITSSEGVIPERQSEPQDDRWFGTRDGARVLAAYVGAAYTNLAEILISKGQNAEAESKLKQFITRKNRFFGKKLDATLMHSFANTLLAYSEALQGKRSESELNLRAAFASSRAFEGFVAARTKRFAGLTYKELGDPDRGRRLLFEALQEYENILPSQDLEVNSCRFSLEQITPGLDLSTSFHPTLRVKLID